MTAENGLKKKEPMAYGSSGTLIIVLTAMFVKAHRLPSCIYPDSVIRCEVNIHLCGIQDPVVLVYEDKI